MAMTISRIDSFISLRWGKKLKCSIAITKETNICEHSKDENKCVVFTNGEHIIIHESYKRVKSIINNLE